MKKLLFAVAIFCAAINQAHADLRAVSSVNAAIQQPYTNTSVTANNTVAETTMFTYALPPLSANSVVNVNLSCDYLNNTGDATNRQYTLRIKLGATTVFADDTSSYATSTIRRGQTIRFSLYNLNSVSSQSLQGNFQGGGGTTTTGYGDISATTIPSNTIMGSATENTSTSKTLAVTMQLATASANLEVRCYAAQINIIQ
jgi:hypothetical protein